VTTRQTTRDGFFGAPIAQPAKWDHCTKSLVILAASRWLPYCHHTQIYWAADGLRTKTGVLRGGTCHISPLETLETLETLVLRCCFIFRAARRARARGGDFDGNAAKGLSPILTRHLLARDDELSLVHEGRGSAKRSRRYHIKCPGAMRLGQTSIIVARVLPWGLR